MNLTKYLPLTETTLYIMLALTQPAHGYYIMQKAEELSGGRVRIAAGTMYGALENLLSQKLIENVPSADARRKLYRLSETGREVLQLEIERLRHIITVAQSIGF